MNFFSPERAETSPGNKAILLDGSALPIATVYPISEANIRLSMMLRNYKGGGTFTYSQHSINLLPTELSAFFTHYIEDPEDTLLKYFGWKPQRATKLWSPNDFKKPSAAVKPEPSAEDKALLDLL